MLCSTKCSSGRVEVSKSDVSTSLDCEKLFLVAKRQFLQRQQRIVSLCASGARVIALLYRVLPIHNHDMKLIKRHNLANVDLRQPFYIFTDVPV